MGYGKGEKDRRLLPFARPPSLQSKVLGQVKPAFQNQVTLSRSWSSQLSPSVIPAQAVIQENLSCNGKYTYINHRAVFKENSWMSLRMVIPYP